MISRRAVLIGLFITGIATWSNGQSYNDYSLKANHIIKTVEKFHLKTYEFNDGFAEILIRNYVENLDQRGLLFISDDFNDFDNIKAEILESNAVIQPVTFQHFENITTRAAKRAIDIINSIDIESINFSTKDSMLYEIIPRYVGLDEIENKWIKWIKFRTLIEWSGQEGLHKEEERDRVLQNILKAEITKELCDLENYIDSTLIKKRIGETYLDGMSRSFDPHTNYFNFSSKLNFDKSVSDKISTFGINFQRNGLGKIEVESLVPGGPAWNSNLINEGDILVSIKTNNSEFMTATCGSSEDVNIFLANIEKGNFKIEKRNGKRIEVPLTKAKVDVEENVIRFYLMEGNHKVGYLNLPSFYHQGDNASGKVTGCANDVARELSRLKRENIKGLILDLRDNGGGSLLEAIRLAGLFINQGAIAMQEIKDESPRSIKDMYRGTLFNQPLVVLVNSTSASATEIFSAALQDYNRAVIVGSKTYGKSTGQIVLPIDAHQMDLNAEKNTQNSPDFVKVTTSAFYRVKGTSLQGEGVEPDIKIPDFYEGLILREGDKNSSIKLDTIEQPKFFEPLKPLPIDILREKSENRIINNPEFMRLKRITKKQNEGLFYFNLSVKTPDEGGNEVKLETPSEISVKLPPYEQQIQMLLKGKEAINLQVDKIKDDSYIIEVYKILCDLIEINKN